MCLSSSWSDSSLSFHEKTPICLQWRHKKIVLRDKKGLGKPFLTTFCLQSLSLTYKTVLILIILNLSLSCVSYWLHVSSYYVVRNMKSGHLGARSFLCTCNVKLCKEHLKFCIVAKTIMARPCPLLCNPLGLWLGPQLKPLNIFKKSKAFMQGQAILQFVLVSLYLRKSHRKLF